MSDHESNKLQDATPQYKSFPPFKSHLTISTETRSAALQGLTLYTPSRPRGNLIRGAVQILTRIGGPRWIPGRAVKGRPLDVFVGGTRVIETILANYGEWDYEAIYTRRQPGRPGGAVLLFRGDRPWLFIKVGPHPTIRREYASLTLLDERSAESFRAPQAIATHELDQMALLILKPLPLGVHRAVKRPPLTSVLREIRLGLQGLERSTNAPSHWVPAHGDLSPWNLRMGTDHLCLFDWEDAGYAPPRSDELYYRLSSDALGLGGPPMIGDFSEAASYWRSTLRRRGDSRLTRSMLRVLADLD